MNWEEAPKSKVLLLAITLLLLFLYVLHRVNILQQLYRIESWAYNKLICEQQ